MRVKARTLAAGTLPLAATALVATILGLFFVGAGAARGDVFSMGGPNLKNLEFVSVGDPGNAADTTGYGAVAYPYRMGKFDVTAAIYAQFLNAVASQSDPFGLYNPNMAGGPGSAACGITRTGSPGYYSYNTTSSGYAVNNGNFPVNYVSWGDAARFANWLTNGQPTNTTEGVGTTETGSYTLNGAMDDSNLMTVIRNPGARYVIPTEDEWYKAAYYDPNKPGGAGYWAYPTRSDTAPSNVLDPNGTNNANFYNRGFTDPTNRLTVVGAFGGSPGQYGTYDMGGDLYQWNDANIWNQYSSVWDRGIRGGSFYTVSDGQVASGRGYTYPTYEGTIVGFRVAEVPEPASVTLLAVGCLALLRQRKRAKPAHFSWHRNTDHIEGANRLFPVAGRVS